jgi:predicted PolB exonuclease-like 3'-5' exonuclease
MTHVLVWDIETVPDLAGFAAANGHDGKSDDEIRAELGDKFPKHIYHSIICIGALIAHNDDDHWVVDALGAPHVGDRSERDLIAAFVDRIAELNPQLVTFNGSSFDLPVLRYRAMIHKVPAIGLKQGNGALPERDRLGSPEQNSSRHIKAEWSERINRRHCRLEPDSETFSNFFGTALRLPAGIAAISHVLPPASVAAEYEDWPGALAVRGDRTDRSVHV